MTLATAATQEVISKYGRNANDTGSSEVQIALLTGRITHISGHLKEHANDKHSTRGLLKIVGKRRRLLNYLKRHNPERYRSLIAELGIRK